MQCLILAGGLGTRLQGLAPDIDKTAKVLIDVAGRPFADHQLSWLADQGVRRVVYCIGHLGDQVREFVGDGARWGLQVAYVDEGGKLLGTGGAIRLALDEGALDDGFLVLYGDSYLNIDIKALWAASDEGRVPVMSVLKNDGRWDASNASFDGAMVTRFEKGLDDPAAEGLDYIDYGMSVLNRQVIEAHIACGQIFDLAELSGRLAEAGALRGFEASQRFYEIGSPEGLARLEAYLASMTWSPPHRL